MVGRTRGRSRGHPDVGPQRGSDHCGASGLVLSPRVQSCRQGEGHRSEGRRDNRPGAAYRNNERKHPKAAHVQSGGGLPASSMQGSVQSAGSLRHPASWAGAAEGLRTGSGGRLGDQPPEGQAAGGVRRARSPSSSRARGSRSTGGGVEGPWEEGKEGSKRKEGRKERGEEKERQKSRKRRRSRECDELVGGRQGRWDYAPASRQEKSPSPFRRDRFGSPGKSSTESGQASQEESAEAKQERQFKRFNREHGLLRRVSRRYSRRRSVSAGVQGATGCSGEPGHPGQSDAQPDEDQPAERDWLRRQTGGSQGLRLSILPAANSQERRRSCSERNAQHCSRDGCFVEWQCGQRDGHSRTEIQVSRSYNDRDTLDGVPEVGDCPNRLRAASAHGGDAPREEGRVRREPPALAGLPTGWTDRGAELGQREQQDEGRQQGQQQRRRKRPPLGKGSPEQRRCQQETRGGASEDLIGRILVQKDESGGGPLERIMSGSSHQEQDGYEGGMVMAPCRQVGTGTPEQLPETKLQLLEGSEQSLHVSTPKRADVNSFDEEKAGQFVPAAAVDSALEMMAGAFVSACGKKDARECISGKTLGECGKVLSKWLLEVLPLRSQPTGKVSSVSVFPLPTSRRWFLECFTFLSDVECDWMVCVTSSLNSLWGTDIVNDAYPNPTQQKCLEGLVKEVKRFCAIEHRLEELDWDAFFSVRSIDYRGDEVKVARKFSWANVAPALPKEVGKVPLADLCTLGSRHYVLNFDQYLKPRCEWRLPKVPKVMVEEGDWEEVCVGLVESGVCTFIEEHEVFHTDEGPLLNGLFGVTKDEWTEGGVEIYRLIMNLVPLNSLCRPMSGDVDTLPSWSTMSPFFVQPSQC